MLLEIWTQRGQQGISGAPAVTKNSYTDTLLLGKTTLDVTKTRWAPQGGNKLRWLERSNGNNFRDKFPWRMAFLSEGKLKFTTFFFGEAWSGCCATVAARTARRGDQKWCFGDPTEQRLRSKYTSLSTNFERWERESPGKRHLLYKNQVDWCLTVLWQQDLPSEQLCFWTVIFLLIQCGSASVLPHVLVTEVEQHTTEWLWLCDVDIFCRYGMHEHLTSSIHSQRSLFMWLREDWIARMI